VQGAVLRVKLKYLDKWTEARRLIASRYMNELADCKSVILPRAYMDRRHVYHIFAVRVDNREGFMHYLNDHGVQSAIHYPFAVHTLEGYASLGYEMGDFPVAEKVASEVVSIPMFPELKDEQVTEVIRVIKAWDEEQNK
jgi:dTDP-4-amino-4,6-dideoxygalactose transaminase